MKKMFWKSYLIIVVWFFNATILLGQPNWPAIKSNATFQVPDRSYGTPYLQPLQVAGWEDGLFMTRDGLHMFSTYLPLDAFSWLNDLLLDPICFNFRPYFRPPLVGIDTVTNIFGCPNFMQSDIVISSRTNTTKLFTAWTSSNLQTPFSFDGGAHGVLLNADTFDVFVYTKDGPGTQNTDIMFMKNVPVNPSTSTAKPILSTKAQEDNPHIERLNASTLLLVFDRDRFIYYSLSYDNGSTWQTPRLITKILNDQAPYDVQPHLWHDGTDWWVYFCADNSNSIRCIYKSKQLIPNNWDSWGPKELVIEPGSIVGGHGTIFGVGEPTLSQWGDLSFVVVYGNTTFSDTTDVFDCDPWMLPKIGSPLTSFVSSSEIENQIHVFPNPANDCITICLPNIVKKEKAQITNAIGVLLMEVTITENVIKINIDDLSKGIYFIKTTNNPQTNRRFIKE